MNWKLLYLVSLFSYCGTSAPLVLTPNDPFAFLGECLKLNCTLSSTQYGNSSTLYYTFKENIFSSDHYKIVDEKTMEFTKCIQDISEAGTYICKQNFTNAQNQMELLFDGQVVRIEKALVPIPKDSIHCIVTNWKYMNCTWSLGENYLQKNEINVSLSFKIINIAKCPKLLQTSCQWSRRYADLTMPMKINLTVFHQRKPEKKFVTYFELPRDKIVKPAQVQLSSNPTFTNSSCFKIEWRHQYFFKVKYNITLNSKFDGNKTILRNVKNLEVCDLLPGETYKVGISAFPKKGPGIWSEPRFLFIHINRTYPSQPPSLTQSSFKWDENHSTVVLYWQCLIRSEYGANEVWYIIDIENQTAKASSGNVQIKLPQHMPDKCWFIRLWAENSLGRSKNFSSLKICNNTSVPPFTLDVEMLMLNSTYVKVMWLNPSIEATSLSGFTVFFCKNCSVDLQWLNVSANKSSVILQLENNSKYSFGVAAENFNGSSGLTWGRCFYYKKRPLKPVDEFSVEPFYDKLQIDWKPYDCFVEKAYIIEYKIKYCKALNNSQCNEAVKEKTVHRTERKFQTPKLSPDYYLVWVEPLTYGGSGPSSVKKMVKISSSSLSTAIIVVIAIASFLVSIFIILGCVYAYKKCSYQIAKCDPSIDFPVVPQNSYDTLGTHRVNTSATTHSEGSSLTSSANTEITQLFVNFPSLSNDKDSDISHQFTSKQNENNNAFCSNPHAQNEIMSDYVAIDEIITSSDEGNDKVLENGNCMKDTQLSSGSDYSFCSSNSSNVTDQTAEKFIPGNTPVSESTETENLEESPIDGDYFPNYVKNSLEDDDSWSKLKTNPFYDKENILEDLSPVQTSSKSNLPKPETNKDSAMNQIHNGFFTENGSSLPKKEMPLKFPGNDLLSDSPYVKIDEDQKSKDSFRLDEFWKPQATNGKSISEGTECELQELNRKEVPI